MTEPEFTIRPLAESDLPEWLRLRKLLWDESSEDDHMAEMVDIIENPESQFVAVADISSGQLVGFLEASIRSFVEGCETENVGYLEGWLVEERYRRRGVGTGLVTLAERWAGEHGCTEMASDAEINNLVSQTAHAKLGYSETSRLVHLRKELG
ncbi:MAG: aminoglycoside 6'-N-acetyltransferase [Pyrinomonadaceae bacterium]